MERRLAAILLTDMVGYSRLMGLDEDGTIARQKAYREKIIDPIISAQGGRIVKTTGDGVLVEFASVVAAVQSAVEIQRAIAGIEAGIPDERRIQYRIGINLGDIVIDNDDILGDGVNVAARLESLAKPGGICISGNVYDQLSGKVDIAFEDAGEQTVKNVARPVRVWHWYSDSIPRGPIDVNQPPSLPDKPSVAVLPFTNMSGDAEQEFFADGMTEEIITGLSRFGSLFVIARNSTFAYKGKSPNVRDVARDLGVRYVLEGSIRRSGSRIRITGQLINAQTGNHLWAERYDRGLDDIFTVQDEVTAAIITAIAPEIDQAEIDKARRTPPNSLGSWGHYLRGLARFPLGAEEDFTATIESFDRAREADPNFVDALAMAALVRLRRVFFFHSENPQALIEQARELLQAGMRLDQRNAICLTALARLHTVRREHELAVSMSREAIGLNPNSALCHHELAISLGFSERWQEAIEQYDTVRRLSPRDPHIAAVYAGRAACFFRLGQYEECVEAGLASSRSPNPRYWADIVLVAALTILGRSAEAAAAKQVLLDRKPDFTLTALRYLRILDTESSRDALRKAGIPE
jgi:adenylate cyclase